MSTCASVLNKLSCLECRTASTDHSLLVKNKSRKIFPLVSRHLGFFDLSVFVYKYIVLKCCVIRVSSTRFYYYLLLFYFS